MELCFPRNSKLTVWGLPGLTAIASRVGGDPSQEGFAILDDVSLALVITGCTEDGHSCLLTCGLHYYNLLYIGLLLRTTWKLQLNQNAVAYMFMSAVIFPHCTSAAKAALVVHMLPNVIQDASCYLKP